VFFYTSNAVESVTFETETSLLKLRDRDFIKNSRDSRLEHFAKILF